MKRLITLTAFLISAASLCACSTVQGVGKDLTKASEAVERSM